MKLVATLLAALALLGCSGTETGNPSVTGQISQAAQASNPGVAAIGASQGGLGVTTAWMTFGALSLVDCAHGSTPQVILHGPAAEDLLSPAPRTFTPHGGPFCELDAPLAHAQPPLPAGAPLELAGATMVIGGKRGDGVPFVVVSHTAPALALTSVHGFAVDDGAHALIVVVDVSALFASVDLAGAVLDTSGTARVDSSDNLALLTAFDANVPQAVALYYDANHNGQLDPGEPGPIAAGP